MIEPILLFIFLFIWIFEWQGVAILAVFVIWLIIMETIDTERIKKEHDERKAHKDN